MNADKSRQALDELGVCFLCTEISHRIPPCNAGSPATENPHTVQCAGAIN
nr:hypothetical protein [Escherichia coli]